MIQRVEAGRSLAAGVVSDLVATLSEQIGRGVTASSTLEYMLYHQKRFAARKPGNR